VTQPAKPGDWMENAQNLADGVHCAIGMGVLVITALFAHRWLPFLVAEGMLVPFVLVKEYWYDLKYETGETVRSSTVDALGYLIGNAAGWLLLFVAAECGTWVVR
jgi:hypothetical protein